MEQNNINFKYDKDAKGDLLVDISKYSSLSQKQKIKIDDPNVKTVIGTCFHYVLTPNITRLQNEDKMAESSHFYGILEIDPSCPNDMNRLVAGNTDNPNYSFDSSAYGILVLPKNLKEAKYKFNRENNSIVLIYAKGATTKVSAVNITKDGAYKCIVVQNGRIHNKPLFAPKWHKEKTAQQIEMLLQAYPDAL